jgi:signal transduction histidine kinase
LNFKRHFPKQAVRQSGIILLAAIAFYLFGTPACLAQKPAGKENSRPKRVLMIFNESKDVPGNILLEQAVRDAMQSVGTNQIEFLSEYLDASHFSDSKHFRVFEDYLGKKYAAQNLDLIISFPSRDYRLVDDLPKALFPKVPVVFVAINEMEVPKSFGKRGVTGIVQRFDIRGTLALIMRLQPDTRHVVVVGGVSDVDRATLGQIVEATHSLEGVGFQFWTNWPVPELSGMAKSLREGTVILLSSVLTDVNGRTFFMSQLAQTLSPSASVPIYSIGPSAIGAGALGGSVVNTDDLGARTGELALQVLRGTKPETLPIQVVTRGTPMVDWRQLRHWRISKNRVPSGTLIRFRPDGLWDEHKDLILILFAVFLAQAVTIGGLLAQRRRRRSAEAVILNQRTELAHVTRLATMGQLTSALAHELNQPLGAILRNAEAAEMFLQKENPDMGEIRAILADIRKDDQRAGNVIERMRSLLKRRSLELKSLNMEELLNETVKLAQSDARARQVSLILQIPPELPSVRGDRVHLQQVLLNLILNGMDAMADVPKFQRLLTVGAKTAKDGSVEVSVTDRGNGIAPEKIDSLFEPFFTTKPDGMGMGLAISQTIIEAHGGDIWGGNIFPRGAVFIFTLPQDDN